MAVLVLLSLVCLGSAAVEVEYTTAFGYIERIGIPLAEKIYEAEKAIINRIVGGSPATLGQIPYQAGLLSKYNNINGTGVCGGSLVTTNRVITAAHCWNDGQNQANYTTVVLGSTLLFSGGTRQETSDVVVHPDWMPNLIRNDIAIIYLPEAVTYSNTISPIVLPSGPELDEDYSGETGTASGFGLRASNSAITSDQYLSHVDLRIIRNSMCRLAFPTILQDSNICTSGLNKMSTCQGDSGGPLVVMRNSNPVLVGITSFGSALGCDSRLPAAYTRVTSFVDFINENLE